MLISHSHEFIFIHNYKVAGTSIRSALSKYTPWYKKNRYSNTIYNLLCKVTSSYVPHHATAFEIKNNVPPEIWDNYFKFAFVRNPWDWQVSLYFFMLKNKSHHQHELIRSMNSFEEYIEWRVNEDCHLQKEFLVDDVGNLIVDYIGKYENLQDDFDEICRQIGINASLTHKNKSKHKDYREYYNDYTRNLIEEAFKEDIEMFGYSFDQPKNDDYMSA